MINSDFVVFRAMRRMTHLKVITTLFDSQNILFK